MNTTPDLIKALSANLVPVRRLRKPGVRAACWLVFAALILALLAISQGLRPDLVQRLHDRDFALGIAGSLLTGGFAALAAFMASLPDRSRLWLLAPLPALALWLANIGYQCLTQWVSLGADDLSLGETARCFATLVLTSLPLSLTMLLMLNYAAALRPAPVALMAALAVAAMTATALSLFHALEASVMVLMWNLGTTILFITLAGMLTRGRARRQRLRQG